MTDSSHSSSHPGGDLLPRHVPPLGEMTLADIPPAIGLFPLKGALLLPEGKLPLNIFEPRYIALVEDALAGKRMIGMIQPSFAEKASPSALHCTGTLGRITAFMERSDGSFAVTLSGICRFLLLRDELTERGWRKGWIDASPFAADFLESTIAPLDRNILTDALRYYFDAHHLQADWDMIDKLEDESLLTALPMLLPFNSDEKQALLEARTLDDRAGVLLGLLIQDKKTS